MISAPARSSSLRSCFHASRFGRQKQNEQPICNDGRLIRPLDFNSHRVMEDNFSLLLFAKRRVVEPGPNTGSCGHRRQKSNPIEPVVHRHDNIKVRIFPLRKRRFLEPCKQGQHQKAVSNRDPEGSLSCHIRIDVNVLPVFRKIRES